MGFIKRIFQLSLNKREIVRSKRFMAILMIPIFVIQMSSLNLFLMQAVIAEDGESDVAVERGEIKEAPPEEEPAPDEIEKADSPKEEVEISKAEEDLKESPADKEAPVVLEEIIPSSISEVIDEVKEEIPLVVAPEIIQEEVVENDEGGRITPEAAYDENLEAPVQAPIVEEPKVEEGWRDNSDGSSSITVAVGNEYVYKDSELKIKFTRIDNGTGEITVKEIELTPEQVTALGALSNKAWDITSGMADGTFEYELTLPVAENVDENKIELVYVEEKEDLDNENKIKKVEKEDVKVDGEKNELVANGLDHFTVYLVKEKSINENLTIASSGVTIIGGCMEDIAKKKLTCTANDAPTVGVTDFTILDDGCKSPDDTVEFSATWSFKSNASQRYNIGLYFATGGQSSALNGTCSVSILPNSPVSSWFNFDGNICGDIASEATVYPETTMTVECLDSDGDNKLNVPYCSSWEQNSSICNGPADTIPGAPSKCSCDDGFEIPITVPYKAQIELIKDLIPSTDEGRFNLQIDGVDRATNVGDGGTTGKVIVGAGTSEDPGDTHIVSESAYGGTNISDYTSSISCVDRGTNTFDGGSPLVVSGVGPLSVPVQKDDDVVCTVTNSINKATITINKIVKNDNGGSATINDFQAKLDGDNVSWSTPIEVLPGTYIVSETNLPGYTATFSGDCDNNGLIVVNSQENKTCTITNDDQPGTLIVKKEITNDDGGNNVCQDFSFSYGVGAISFEEDCQNEISVPAGIYNITETRAIGYATTYENCTNISVPNGGSATCTIKNDDVAPSLSVIKKVINDDGGDETLDAFEIKMNDNLLSFGAGVPSGDTTVYTSNPIVKANASYTLSEKDLAGYIEGTWNCKTVAGASVAYPVTLTEGQNVICEISNDDIAPTITLIKEVINNNGGQAGVNDFGLSIGGVGVTSGQVYPVEANAAYALNEIGLSGYEFVSITGDAKCPIALGGTATLNEGENITCTIKNDDKPGKLTVIKIVDNKFGGNLNPEDFTINVSGVNSLPASFPGNSTGTVVTLDAGSYDVTENLIDGYVPKYSSDCSGNINIGDNKVCTITNEDQAPKLTLVKKVINDDGGTKQVADFPLFIGDVQVTSGVATILQSNIEYSVSETNLSGYTPSAWSGACSPDGKITLNPGDNKICYIANDDIQPKLTVTKVVNNSNYGNLAVADFPLYVGATSVISGVQNGFDAGSYVVSETGKPGYSVEISGDCDPNGNVTLTPGDVKSCTITNTDNLGKIIIEKQTLPDGDTQMFTFNGDISGSIADDGKLEKIVAPGNYIVSEVVPSGWDLTGLVCEDPNSNSLVSLSSGTATINVEANETVKCTFTNTQRSSITIKKNAIPDGASNFTFTRNFGDNFQLDDDADPNLQNEITFNNLIPGNYFITENPYMEWILSDLKCSDPSSDSTVSLEERKANVVLGAGESVICEFTNTQRGTVKIIKKTLGGDDAFNFSSGTLPDSDFDITTISQEGSKIYGNLQPGTYDVSEIVPTDWNLTSLSCNDPDKGSSVDLVNKNFLADLDPGETVTCTFTNTKKSNLTVAKKVINDNGGTKTVDDFGINFSGGGLNFDAGVTLGSTTTYTAQTLTVDPGNYNLSENDVVGYTEGAWDCGIVGASGISTSVSLAPGENKTCTIVNNDISPTVTLVKEVIGGIANPNSFGLSIEDVAVDSGFKTNVPANTPLALNEIGLAGYTFTSLAGGEGCPEALGGTVTLKEGEEITCTITNTRDTGSITVNKIIDMDGNLQTTEDQVSGVGWQFDVDGTAGDTSDPVADFTGAEGNVSFADLKTGEYTIVENKQSGYNLVAADCGLENGIFDGIDSMDNVSVDKDGNTICNFYNVPNGTIHGYKWSDLNGNGERDCIEESGEDLEPVVFDDSEMYQCELEPLLSGWTINLYQSNGEGGFGSEPIRTMVTDSGSEHFGWYWFENLPLGEYKVCEVLEDDWRQTHPLNSDDNCHLISLPSGNSNGFGLPAMLNAVDGPVYSFGNQQLARVAVIKFEDLDGNGQKDEGEDYLPDWEINLSGQDSVNTDENGEVVFDELLPESYVLSETLQPGWNQTNIYCEDNNGSGVKITSEGEAYGHHGNCEGWNQCGDAENCAQWACRVRGYSSLVSHGESRPCTQFNNCHLFQRSVISDPPILSIDSSYQDNEYIDYDWGNSCNVMGVTDIIYSNPGFSEAMILSEDDSESDLVSENNYRLALSAGDSKTCYVGNQFITPELTISKYNNQWPTVQSPGSIIDYTIKVEALENNVNGVVVTDLPPEGFKYISGSWSATSSLGGGHDGALELSHEYASPGEWSLGDMKSGEVITLSYKAQIDSAQQPGLYNDLAWADGTDDRSTRVLATSMPAPAVDPGEITDNFVGTQIELAVAPAPQNVELEEDEETETKTKKKVLGVTTYLPATGTPTMWIILALVILIAGIGLIIFARRKNNKMKNMTDKTLMGVVILTGMIFLGANAEAMAPAIRLAQPTTPTEIKNQNIAFSVLDIDNRPITVDCYKKSSVDSDWVNFSTVNLPSGGSSGVCAINLDTDGGYDFYTEATAGGEVSKSKTVSLSLNTAIPGIPRKYNRNGGSCSVSFTTADDGGLTGKVVLYRSKNTEFVADDSTKVQEGNFTSNVEGVLTDPNDNCDDYYYAIQAVSEGGLRSSFVGDEDVDVETRTRTRTVYEENIVYTGGEAIPAEEVGGTITEEAGATATEGGVTEEGAVQGEATEGALSEGAETDQGKVAGMFSDKNSKWGWILVGLAALGSAYYMMRRKSKKKVDIPSDEN